MAVRLDTEIRREQIISAALGLIGEKGLKNLRMPDIAQKVGLVPSALYRHFSSKQELVLAIVDSIRASLEKHLARSGEETPDPLERLEFIMDEHLKMIGGSPGMPLLVLSEDAAFGDPKMRRRVLEIHEFFRKAVADIMKEAIKTRRVGPDTDPGEVALVFVSLIQHTAVMTAISGGDVHLGPLAGKAWRQYVKDLVG